MATSKTEPKTEVAEKAEPKTEPKPTAEGSSAAVQLRQTVAQLEGENVELEAEIAKRDKALKERDAEIAALRKRLQQSDQVTVEDLGKDDEAQLRGSATLFVLDGDSPKRVHGKPGDVVTAKGSQRAEALQRQLGKQARVFPVSADFLADLRKADLLRG